MRARVLAALALFLLLPGSAAAQSLTALRGLGYPMLASDARSEALGGLGIGLVGLSVPFTNPASAAGVQRRGVSVTAAATERTSTLGSASAETGATRFPLVRVLLPVRGVVATVGYGTYLDQSWAVIRQRTQSLGPNEVASDDVIQSVGGVGEAKLGVAVPVGDRLAVGVTLGRYTGGQDVTLRRRFDSTGVGALLAYNETRGYQYSGTTAQVGVRYDIDGVLRLAGSVKYSGALNADSTSGAVSDRSFDLPVQVAVGGSAYLSSNLLAAVSGRWSGWSATDPAGVLVAPDEPVTSRDTWELGAGLELDNPESRDSRSHPLRVGFQYRQLPFGFVSDAPREWTGSLGLGMRIGTNIDTPLARLDLTVQRGARTASGDGTTPALDESFWRFVLGLSLFGN